MAKVLDDAGLTPVQEPAGLIGADSSERPADLAVLDYTDTAGLTLAVDVSCRRIITATGLEMAATRPKAALVGGGRAADAAALPG